jgi:spore maturation protein CgeB
VTLSPEDTHFDRDKIMMAAEECRYLWVYSAADEWTVNWHELNRRRRIQRGFDVVNFCNTPMSLERRWFPFPELDRLWKAGYKPLMEMYERLAEQLIGRDVLILYNGANLHPEFVVSMKNVMKVYTCGDPESSDVLSKPVAHLFDIHLVNQFSEMEKFRNWGLSNVYFWPLGSFMTEEDVSDIDENSILDVSRRAVPTVLFAEYNAWRRSKLDVLKKSFPDGLFAGRGWGCGFVGYPELWGTYRKAQIGWNIHNSTGFNFRTYDLPAHGVMQICDNKSDLAKIFSVDEEVVGFDDIRDCVELSRYYLAHPQEQRAIALAGWKRWRKDYTPEKVWDKLVAIVDRHRKEFSPEVPYDRLAAQTIIVRLTEHRRRTEFKRAFFRLSMILIRIFRESRHFLRHFTRRDDRV